VKADTLTVKDIFSKDIRYVVPLFQRPYVWTKENHWEPLWEDVTAVAERLLDELKKVGPGEEVRAEERTPPHFMGAVVVDQLKTAVADIEARHVIDGQQRLTTLQLLLDSVQAVIAELGEKRAARLLGKLILNDEEVIKNSDDAYKVWPTNVDQDAFRAVMDDAADAAEFSENPIVQAHEFFGAAALEWITEATEAEQRERRVSALSTTLQGLLQLVVIDLEPHDNAQVIFETLNARGTPLLASDLVKNLVLQAADRRGLDVQALYDKYWQAFDERDYWRAEIRQGRLTRPRIDVYLYYWLIMRRAEEVSIQEVFPAFRRYLKDRGNDVEAVLADLARGGRIYQQLDDIPSTSREGIFIYRWRTLDAQTLTPVLLWLFDQPNETLAPAERIRALKAIESWLIRRTVCRLTTKDYNRLFIELISALSKNPSKSGEITEHFLAAQTADARMWPSDRQLIDAFLTVPVYSLLTRSRLRMTLEALEDAYRGPKSEDEFVTKGKLTIEHVLPQAWRDNWPLFVPEGETEEVAALQRDRFLHTFGNLTLVTKALNPALSNSAWTVKKEELSKYSVLHLTKRLLEANVADWNETAIEARGRQLAGQAIKIWPRTGTV
jgi:Protein of unknown function DUF262/Protein of unknown function (DUF1524)